MDKTKKEKLREVPKKNYIYLALILLGSLLLLIYICNICKVYNENKLNVNIMGEYLTVINYNELDNYITENKDAIIYVSVLGNVEINNFEKSFKKSILENNLRDSILYLDLTNENIPEVTDLLQIDENFPHLVVYTNGKITDTYNIAENNYSVKKTINYLNRIGATDND